MANFANFLTEVNQNISEQKKKYQPFLDTMNSLVQKQVFDLEKKKVSANQNKQIAATAQAMGIDNFQTPTYINQNNEVVPVDENYATMLLSQKKTEQDNLDALRGQASAVGIEIPKDISYKEALPLYHKKVQELNLNNQISVLSPQWKAKFDEQAKGKPIEQQALILDKIKGEIAREQGLSDYETKQKIDLKYSVALNKPDVPPKPAKMTAPQVKAQTTLESLAGNGKVYGNGANSGVATVRTLGNKVVSVMILNGKQYSHDGNNYYVFEKGKWNPVYPKADKKGRLNILLNVLPAALSDYTTSYNLLNGAAQPQQPVQTTQQPTNTETVKVYNPATGKIE